MSTHVDRTHLVAAAAYIFREDRVLLLKRVSAPFTYAPPGGKLERDEDPIAGLLREIDEETGLTAHVLGVAHTWFGSISAGKPQLLCINYVAESGEGDVRLSDEHTDFVWASREDILTNKVQTRNEGYGYRPEGILEAFEMFARLRVTA